MTTSTDIVNQALTLAGHDASFPVTGVAPTFDGSVAGRAAAELWGAALLSAALWEGITLPQKRVALLAAEDPPLPPWLHAYTVPEDAVNVLQVTDLAVSRMASWTMGFSPAHPDGPGLILTDEAEASALCSVAPPEEQWSDALKSRLVEELRIGFARKLGEMRTEPGP